MIGSIYNIYGNLLAGALGIGPDDSPDLLGDAALPADDLSHVVGGDAQLQRQLLGTLHLSDRDGLRIIHKVSGDGWAGRGT